MDDLVIGLMFDGGEFLVRVFSSEAARLIDLVYQVFTRDILVRIARVSSKDQFVYPQTRRTEFIPC